MSNEVDQIKERLNIAEVLGEYIKLEKSGVNYKALCPFHNEKTPSFTVNTERNFWYCFGCQEGGDIFTFVQKIEGLDFREALEKLAEKANVELPKFNNKNYQEEKSKKQIIYDILKLATKVYQKQLITDKNSSKIIQYLKERGFTKEVVHDFKIGYAPDAWKMLISYLVKKDFTVDAVLQAGLAVLKNDTGQASLQNCYDRFRNRIIFPILDVSGKTIGYSARVVPEGNEKSAKYINTPQSMVYNKSKVLYGLFQSRQAIRKSGYAIVVEGNADVVLSHSIGVKNVVAISGTAMTEEQVALLKRYTNRVMLSFDMDEAGQKATRKSIQVCLRNDLEVKIILLSKKYKDVGDVVKDNPDKWSKFIKKAVPVMEYYFDVFLLNSKQNDIQHKKKAVNQLIDVIKDIADPIERSYWLKKLSIKADVEENLLTDLLKKVRLKNNGVEQNRNESRILSEKRNSNKVVAKKKSTRYYVLQSRLIGLVAKFMIELEEVLNDFKADKYLSPDFLLLFKSIVNKDISKEQEFLVNEYISKLIYKKEGDSLLEVEVDPFKEWEIVLREISKIRKQKKIKEIERQLKHAEEEGKEDEANRLLMQLNKIINI